MMRKILLYCIFLLGGVSAVAQSVKGMYVNDFIDVVGDTVAENQLLTLAQAGDFNYLILYNLYHIHNNLFSITDPVASAPLANFIKKAKTQYGIDNVAATGETFASFTNIHDYQQDHAADPDEQFDYYNIEFEFWNASSIGPGGYYCTTYLEDEGLSCDTIGSFAFLEENLCDLKALCDADPNLSAEMYVGHFNAGQGKKIAACTDRVLVHYYRTSDVYNDGSSIYNYHAYRLPHLAADDELSIVMPIFSCRSYHMGPWLDSHTESQAFDTWMNGVDGYNDDTGAWKSNNQVDGYVWYRYTCLSLSALPVELLYFGGRNTKDKNILYWELGEVSNFNRLEIERKSGNQKEFEYIASIQQPYGINAIWADDAYTIGTNYYRLKFVDNDESYTYSHIITIDNERANWMAKVTAINGGWQLVFDGASSQKIEINVVNINGQKVYSQTLSLQQATGWLIPTYELISGVYFITVEGGRYRQTFKKILQH